MKQHQELLKVIELLEAKDSESNKLGMKLFKTSSFMKQFQGNLSCLGFLFPNYRKGQWETYMSYKDLCNNLPYHPEILKYFVNNKYKAFLIIKNNRIDYGKVFRR